MAPRKTPTLQGSVNIICRAVDAGVFTPGATGMMIAYGVHYDTGPLPWIAQFLGDIYWVHPERVRADLIKFRRAG